MRNISDKIQRGLMVCIFVYAAFLIILYPFHIVHQCNVETGNLKGFTYSPITLDYKCNE